MEDMVNKIHDIVLADCWMKIREIAASVNISTKCIENILHDKLGMRKLSARWVLRLLTFNQKQNRMVTSKQCLAMFKRNPSEFLWHYVTVDETWLHHYTLEMKVQSAQWVFPGKRGPKKARTIPSPGRVMAEIFWDSQAIIFIHYLEKGRTITGQYLSLIHIL